MKQSVANEVEITPAMIEAGKLALDAWNPYFDTRAEAVLNIYLAMSKVAERKNILWIEMRFARRWGRIGWNKMYKLIREGKICSIKVDGRRFVDYFSMKQLRAAKLRERRQ